MLLSLQTLQNFNGLFAAVQSAFDFVSNSPPPSPIGRVRGTLRNSGATLKVLAGQLETREPKAADQGDLGRIQSAIEQLVEDKWVADGLATTSLEWNGDEAVEAAGLTPPATPLSFAASMKLLIDGLTGLQGWP